MRCLKAEREWGREEERTRNRRKRGRLRVEGVDKERREKKRTLKVYSSCIQYQPIGPGHKVLARLDILEGP